MRELGVLGFWVFGCLVGVGGRPSFHSSQKMPRVCFGHACNKKGVASLAKGVVRNGWVMDRVGLAYRGVGDGWRFLWHAHLCWLHSPLLGLAHSPCLSHSMGSCPWKCSYSSPEFLRTPHPAPHPIPLPCPLPRAAATCRRIDVGYCYSPCVVINVGHKLVRMLRKCKRAPVAMAAVQRKICIRLD